MAAEDHRSPTVVVAGDAPGLQTRRTAPLRPSGLCCVLGEAGDRNAVATAEECDPDLIVRDVSMPGLGGRGALSAIPVASPARAVVVCLGSEERGNAERALERAAECFVQTSVPVGSLRIASPRS